MKADEFIRIRNKLGLSRTEMAAALRMGLCAIERIEAGDLAVSGPVSLAMEAFDNGRMTPEINEDQTVSGAGMQNGWMLIRDFMAQLVIDGKKRAIYRGQANATWDVVPSGFRDQWLGIRNEHRLNDWKWRAARFASPMPQDSIEWLIMAQHYGLATPLLDWTTSPLVALFFACLDDREKDQDGCVWISSMTDFELAHYTLMIDPFQDKRAKPFLVNAVGRNARSTAQDSVLTLHTESDLAVFERRRLFQIPARLKTVVLNQLEKLGYTEDRLLYDIAHLVKTMKKEVLGRRFTT